MSGLALATAAQSLVGAPFRLHGRDPATGLDCIGVLVAALAAIGRYAEAPTGYTMRVADCAAWLPRPETWGFAAIAGPAAAGDAMLIMAGPGQPHLVIRSATGGWIHAHAGLRRVVHQPEPPSGQTVHHWRLSPEPEA